MEEQFAKLDIRKDENIVYKKTGLLVDRALSYCPGCGHGTAHRMLMEVIDEIGIQDKTIGVSPVGCSVLAYDFMNIDMLGAAHGRAPALATAIKRMWPDRFVFTYQGDGDLAAIGTAETIHACNRGENFVIIFINNGIYGMTGGQMSPTTFEGDRSTTSIYGNIEQAFDTCELARAAGLSVENGVVVDDLLRASAPDVFAAGDVAATWNARYHKRIRMEHWANALNQGQCAARNMLGQDTAYAKLPYFYSDQYDLGMEYHGYAQDWDRVVLRGDPAGRELLAFWLRDGRVLAGMNANNWDQADDIKALVRSAGAVDAARLADPAVPLADLT